MTTLLKREDHSVGWRPSAASTRTHFRQLAVPYELLATRTKRRAPTSAGPGAYARKPSPRSKDPGAASVSATVTVPDAANPIGKRLASPTDSSHSFVAIASAKAGGAPAGSSTTHTVWAMPSATISCVPPGNQTQTNPRASATTPVSP